MPRKTLDFVRLKGDISVVMVGGETKVEKGERRLRAEQTKEIVERKRG